jgi:two-component system cell cycle response regulator DivK
MVVEDDPGIGAMLQTMLQEHFKLRTVVATGGLTAVVMANETRPDLILADLHLPYISGFEVIRCIKDDPALHDIPIIAFSNHDWDFNWEKRALDAGCIKCSHKVVSVEELGELIGEVLDLNA